MARLYSTENFPLPVVEHLRALGHDVLTLPTKLRLKPTSGLRLTFALEFRWSV